MQAERRQIGSLDTFAVITRRGARPSPGVRAPLAGVEAHMRAVAEELDAER